MSELDVGFTLKILVILIVAFAVITAWNEVIFRIMFEFLRLDRESILGWLVIALISVLFLFLVLSIFRIEAHEAFGISETIDTILTGTKEKSVGTELVQSPV